MKMAKGVVTCGGLLVQSIFARVEDDRETPLSNYNIIRKYSNIYRTGEIHCLNFYINDSRMKKVIKAIIFDSDRASNSRLRLAGITAAQGRLLSVSQDGYCSTIDRNQTT